MQRDYPTHRLVRAISFIVAAFVFIAVFATVSSPFTELWGMDYGTFRTMGLCWHNGGTVYRDAFDHKGPYLFLIQAIACCISHGKWSIYVLESLNLALCLWLLYDIGKLLTTNALRIYTGLAAYLAYFALTVEWGNTVEEWSMPAVLVPLLLCIRYIKQPNDVGIRVYALVIGICFGIVALMRINNAAIIVGIIIGVGITMISRGESKQLWRCTVWAIIGLAVGVLPMVIYFWSKGALSDMIYGTFTFNYKYRQVWDHSPENIRINGLRMLVCIIAIVASMHYDRHHKAGHTLPTLPIVASISIVSAITFLNGATYPHYFTMILPIVFLAVILSGGINKWVQVAMVLIVAIPIARDWEMQRRASWILTGGKTLILDPKPEALLTERFSIIPEAEYCSVYVLHPYIGYTDILYHVGHTPPGKYTQQQSSIAQIDEGARHDIIDNFGRAKPKWVISFYPLEETVLKQYKDDYAKVDECTSTGQFDLTIRLYHRNEDK